MICRLKFSLINPDNASRRVQHSVRMKNSVIGVFLLLCLAGAPARAAAESWTSLTPAQQEALAPLAQQWDTLPEKQKHNLLITAKRYQHMTPEQKQRYHDRLPVWSN